MFKHVVMWKFLDHAEGKTKEENLDYVKGMLEKLPAYISCLRSIKLYKDVTRSESSYDMVLFTEFNSPEDFREYLVHPEHKKISEYVAKVRCARGAVDYFD